MAPVKLSIVTINFNNAAGLQKTVDSVLAQTYKAIEYIIIDGGSTDGSKAILEANSAAVAHWVSETDTGIYNAMNKGIQKAAGEYILFLNSGDFLISRNSIEQVFKNGQTADIVYGNIEANGKVIRYSKMPDFTFFFRDSIPHPASFIKRSLFDRLGLYEEQYKIVSDWAFFLKAIIKEKASTLYLDQTITVYDTTGMSSNEKNAALQAKERTAVLLPYMEANYPALLQGIQHIENELNLYKNSRVIKAIKNLLNKLLGRG